MRQNSTNYAELTLAEAKEEIRGMEQASLRAKPSFKRSSNRDDFTYETPQSVDLPLSASMKAIMRSEEESLELEKKVDEILNRLGLQSKGQSSSEAAKPDLRRQKGRGKHRVIGTARRLKDYFLPTLDSEGGVGAEGGNTIMSEEAEEAVGSSYCQVEDWELQAEADADKETGLTGMDADESLGTRLKKFQYSFADEQVELGDDQLIRRQGIVRRQSFGENKRDWLDRSWPLQEEAMNRIRTQVASTVVGKSDEDVEAISNGGDENGDYERIP